MLDLSKEYLYHYTTTEAAIGIISSGEMWFSAVNRLNDINEICGPEVLLEDDRDKDRLKDLLKHYTQISLTADKNGHYGFDIPAMWGHYAEKGKGVCLIFDKEKILAEVDRREMYANFVTYSQDRDLNEILYDKNIYNTPEDFILACKNEVFFHKTIDWEYEQEFRLITIDDSPANFAIRDAIRGIILHGYTKNELLKSERFEKVSQFKDCLEIFRYKQENGHWNLYDMNDNNLRPPIVYDFSKIPVE